jgi:quinoprotein glucose dehydrogenase
VACVSKAGVLLLLDRVSGKPIVPFRLRRAPVSRLPGERTAPYQPDPELPELISPPDFRIEDVTTRTPKAHAFVMGQVARATYGWFEPFSEGRANLFMGTRGGGEWSGASVDLPTGRLYVTSNRIVSKVTVLAADEAERDPGFPPSAGEVAYRQSCAVCHGPDRAGNGMVPPLIGVQNRMNESQIRGLLRTGRNAMPPAPQMGEAQENSLIDFLLRRNQPPSRPAKAGTSGASMYTFDGYNFLTDDQGYPGIKPPWGLLNCYDLNTGRILWRVPLGEYPELTRQGLPKTGTQNLGGATVTAGGLVFCAGTADQMIRAFDAGTGAELWKARLPWGGYAAPAVYEAGGREFVVITATGGGKVGGPAGDAYVAFALPVSAPSSRP